MYLEYNVHFLTRIVVRRLLFLTEQPYNSLPDSLLYCVVHCILLCTLGTLLLDFSLSLQCITTVTATHGHLHKHTDNKQQNTAKHTAEQRKVLHFAPHCLNGSF